MKIVFTSLFANPFHGGHLALLKAAKQLGDKLVVIVNSDAQVKIKGSKPFLSHDERLDIIRELRCVDDCCIAVDEDGTVAETLARLVQHYNVQSLFQTVVFKEPEHEYIFAKGGDRKNTASMPESELIVCQKFGIEIVYGVGGFDKKNSSSAILDGLENNPSRIVTRSDPLPLES